MTCGLMIGTSPHIYIHLQASRPLRMHPIGPIAARIISISVLELPRHWMQRVKQFSVQSLQGVERGGRSLETPGTPADSSGLQHKSP